jgi:hypothetical protein
MRQISNASSDGSSSSTPTARRDEKVRQERLA